MTDNTNTTTNPPVNAEAGKDALPMFVASNTTLQQEENALDLDELFQDCYFGDFPVPGDDNVITSAGTTTIPVAATAPVPATTPVTTSTTISPLVPNNQFYTGNATTATTTTAAPVAAAAGTTASVATTTTSTTTTTSIPQKRKADDALLEAPQAPVSSTIAAASTSTKLTSSSSAGGTSKKDASTKPLTDQQKVERRERNRKHAKRSRLRKKFLLESLQDQINGLQSEIESLKGIIRKECPTKANELLESISGPKGKFTPLPMPSGFGPVKTLMQPDFRLMSALSGSQQNFAISDPSLPDNPIVYVSQGFLELTGYKLDQVLGRNCRFLQGPGTDQSAVDIIRKGVREGVDTSVCLLNYKADGTPFWNQFFVAALRDAENNVVNFVGVQCEVSKAVVDQQIAEQKERAEAAASAEAETEAGTKQEPSS